MFLACKRITSSPQASLKIQLCDVNGISLQKKEMSLVWHVTRKGKLAEPHPAALCFPHTASIASTPSPPPPPLPGVLSPFRHSSLTSQQGWATPNRISTFSGASSSVSSRTGGLSLLEGFMKCQKVNPLYMKRLRPQEKQGLGQAPRARQRRM